MSGLWVARDEDGWCRLSISKNAPRLNEASGMYAMDGRVWSMGFSFGEATDLKPGECRRLVMAEETSE